MICVVETDRELLSPSFLIGPERLEPMLPDNMTGLEGVWPTAADCAMIGPNWQ